MVTVQRKNEYTTRLHNHAPEKGHTMKMTGTRAAEMSDPTELTDGWHPGYLLRITHELKPEGFTLMKGTHIYRWHLAVW